MNKSARGSGEAPSERIDERIAELGDARYGRITSKSVGLSLAVMRNSPGAFKTNADQLCGGNAMTAFSSAWS